MIPSAHNGAESALSFLLCALSTEHGRTHNSLFLFFPRPPLAPQRTLTQSPFLAKIASIFRFMSPDLSSSGK